MSKVLIVDASQVFRRGRAQNFLDAAHGAQILGWVQGFADVEDRARVVGKAIAAKLLAKRNHICFIVDKKK